MLKVAVTIFAVKEEEGTLSLNPLDVLIASEDDVCKVLGQFTGAVFCTNVQYTNLLKFE